MNTFLSLTLFVASASAFTIDLKNKGDIEIIDCGELGIMNTIAKLWGHFVCRKQGGHLQDRVWWVRRLPLRGPSRHHRHGEGLHDRQRRHRQSDLQGEELYSPLDFKTIYFTWRLWALCPLVLSCHLTGVPWMRVSISAPATAAWRWARSWSTRCRFPSWTPTPPSRSRASGCRGYGVRAQ